MPHRPSGAELVTSNGVFGAAGDLGGLLGVSGPRVSQLVLPLEDAVGMTTRFGPTVMMSSGPTPWS